LTLREKLSVNIGLALNIYEIPDKSFRYASGFSGMTRFFVCVVQTCTHSFFRSVKIFSLIIVIFALTFSSNQCDAQVIINEVQADNTFTLPDEDLDYPDWIELYNPSNDTVDITDFQLSDRTPDMKWRFPYTVIPPKSFIIVFASGKNRAFPNLHTNFKLSAAGETLYLTDPIFSLHIDSVRLPELSPNISLGRSNFDENTFIQFYEPSPRSENIGIEFNYIYNNKPSGFYNDTVAVQITNNDPFSKIYYTLDGTAPDTNALLYSSDLIFQDQQSDSESLMNIPTTPLEVPDVFVPFVWKEPVGTFSNATVLKFQSYKNGIANSPVISQSYFFENDRGTNAFPIISLTIDKKHLFDPEIGIHIPGNKYENDTNAWRKDWPRGNYHCEGYEWEKPAHIEFFDEFGYVGFNQNIGLRLKGLSSAALPQKSFNIFARNEYGKSRIEYPLFGPEKKETYKRFSLRNSGNDFTQTHFRDAFLQSLLKDLDLETQAFKRSLLYINGEYWGIMNIREKYSKFYFQDYFNVEEWQLDLLKNKLVIQDGDSLDFQSILDFVEINSLENEDNYQYIDSKIDLDNFIDYHIAEIYFGNFDWPGNNVAFWRNRKNNSKWRWLVLDLDISYAYIKESFETYYGTNLFDVLMDENSDAWPNPQWSTLLFRSLIKNKNFQNKFIDRSIYHLNHTFEINKSISQILAFQALFEPEMERHIKRWGHPKSMNTWNGEINSMIEFAQKRHCVLKQQLLTFFDLESIDITCYDNVITEVPVIYPNPIKDHFVVAFESAIETSYALNLFNAQGKLVLSKTINVSPGVNLIKITNVHLPHGTYIASILDLNFSQKLVVFD